MEPWLQLLYSPMMNLRFPSSGDVLMDYSPSTNWGRVSDRAGNPKIEDEIFRDVALPGKQLGRMLDAVNALIEIVNTQHPDRCEDHKVAFSELESMTTDILRKKNDLQQVAAHQAEEALKLLKSADFEAFQKIILKYRQDADAPNEQPE